jgi:hypothetical protein
LAPKTQDKGRGRTKAGATIAAFNASTAGGALFDRHREAADQSGNLIQASGIGRLDCSRKAGEAFIVAELRDISRQNRGGQMGTVDLEIWHGNQLRKNAAGTKLDLDWVDLEPPAWRDSAITDV